MSPSGWEPPQSFCQPLSGAEHFVTLREAQPEYIRCRGLHFTIHSAGRFRKGLRVSAASVVFIFNFAGSACKLTALACPDSNATTGIH